VRQALPAIDEHARQVVLEKELLLVVSDDQQSIEAGLPDLGG
jgi:hypothetical protein